MDDVKTFRSVATGIKLLQTIVELYPDQVNERAYKTRANPTGEAHLDKLLGIQHSFAKIKSGEINTAANHWAEIILPYLLY